MKVLLENTTSESEIENLSIILQEMESDPELLEHYNESLDNYIYYKEREYGIALNAKFNSRIINTTVRRANMYESQWGINTVSTDEYLDTVEYDRFKPAALELYKLINGIVKYGNMKNVETITVKYSSMENEIINTKKQLEEAKMDMCNNPLEFTEAKAVRIADLSKRHQELISDPVFSYYCKAVSAVGFEKRINNTKQTSLKKENHNYQTLFSY